MEKTRKYQTLETRRRKARFSQALARRISTAIKATRLLPSEMKYLSSMIPKKAIMQVLRSVAMYTISPNILSRFTFEHWLKETSKRYEPRNEDERIVLGAVREALETLGRQPSLFTGDPYGDFTYDHPVLAIALTEFQTCFRSLGPSLLSFGHDDFASWRFISGGIHACLSHSDKSLDSLTQCVPTESICLNGDVIRIAVAGDAGYDNPAQRDVIREIKKQHAANPFDLFIHLGDTYLSGKDEEFFRNLIGPFSDLKIRRVAVCGNHDLYRGGKGFQYVIQEWEQPGRYLAVQTPDWIIACLDTSLGAPDIGRMNGNLDDGQLKWLEQLIRNKGDMKLVLMTHHYPVSAWFKSKPTISVQLKPFYQDIFAWYWGHEHGCAAYPPAAGGFYGACVGNGAFNERWSNPTVRTQSIDWYAKARCGHVSKKEVTRNWPFLKQRHFWPHGFLELELTRSRISETYRVEGEPPHVRVLPRGSALSQIGGAP